jgi:hypothetical protein
MTPAFESLCGALREHGSTVNDNGHGKAQAQCPAHDDGRASLSVTRIDGSVLLHCHAGCQTGDVLAALKLEMRDLYDERNGAVYRYPDGRKVHRSPSKQFRQSGNTKGNSLFHAELIGDVATVYVVEGEKDVLAVESAGGVAVCPAMGAGKADRFDWEPLRGKAVVNIADKDGPGRKHAAEVAELLDGIATSVLTVEAAVGKDAADHIAASKTLDELVPVHNGAEGMPRLYRATDLKPAAQPRWLAKNRLQRAAINLLIGDEGIGKSLLWVWIVAAVTTGKALPEFGIPVREPAHVVLVCTEDDWATVVRPRLEVAAADLDMVHVICVEDDGSGAPAFPRDLFLITKADLNPALVVVDAWLDTVPAMLSVRDPQQARQALHPWRELATATDAAVWLLCHTNRVTSANARDRYGATGELRKKARMTLYAQSDDEGRLIVGPEKMNTAAPIPASIFSIRAIQHFTATEDSDGTVPMLVFDGESDRTAREYISDSVDAGADEPGGNPAKAFIYDHLVRQGGEAVAGDVMKAGRAAGFNEQELKDARRRHRKPRIVSRKASGLSQGWVWAISTEGGTSSEGGTEGGEGGKGGNTEEAATFETDGEGGTEGGITFPVPPSPPSPPSGGIPPGGLTRDSPGQTDRVQQSLEKARGGSNQPPEQSHTDDLNHGRFQPDPPCFYCDKPVVGKQQDERGRYAHVSCQTKDEETT